MTAKKKISDKKITEFKLISKYLKPLASGFSGALGLSDDVAIIDKDSKFEYVVTTDAMVEGVHFPENPMPTMVASRLLASNLSDIASCGAEPKYYFLNGTIGKSQDEKWFKAFASRASELQEEYKFHLAGGDTVSSKDTLFFSATFIGEVPKGKALLRSGAKVGDNVYVSGNIGEGWLGLEILKGEFDDLSYENKDYFINCYVSPTPRIDLGIALRGIANSCTDVSDGLVKDLENICKTSKVGAEISYDKIPLAYPKKYFDEQVSGGDDYELVFTASEDCEKEIKEIAEFLKLPITKIGKITKHSDAKEDRVKIVKKNGVSYKILKKGYEHE